MGAARSLKQAAGKLSEPDSESEKPPTRKITTDHPEVSERFNRVLADTVSAMDESGIRYAFIGGIASGGLGRPRSTHDIDLFVAPDDSELALRALSKKGFRAEKTDPSWLYKAFKDNILVDIIFKSKGEIYFDSEMYQRLITAEFHGKRLKLVAPEDLLIIKAAAHSELTPNHWHDAIGILTHANLDWGYLIRRAKKAPRRILSLLLYAQSNDVWVPNYVIHDLFQGIFGSAQPAPQRTSPGTQQMSRPSSVYPLSSVASQAHPNLSQMGPSRAAGQAYRVAHLRERLAEDPRCNELDIQIEQSEDTVLLRGEVPVAERREAVERIAREVFPDQTIENQIRVLDVGEPTESESIK